MRREELADDEIKEELEGLLEQDSSSDPDEEDVVDEVGEAAVDSSSSGGSEASGDGDDSEAADEDSDATGSDEEADSDSDPSADESGSDDERASDEDERENPAALASRPGSLTLRPLSASSATAVTTSAARPAPTPGLRPPSAKNDRAVSPRGPVSPRAAAGHVPWASPRSAGATAVPADRPARPVTPRTKAAVGQRPATPERRSPVQRPGSASRGASPASAAAKARARLASGGAQGAAGGRAAKGKGPTAAVVGSDDRLSSSAMPAEQVFEEIDPFELEYRPQPIGEGSYGVVFAARWHGTSVAVKKVRGSKQAGFTPAQVGEFRSEVALMRRLRHPNIVLFLGEVSLPDQLCIVTQFCENGSLYDVLHKQKLRYALPHLVKIGMGPFATTRFGVSSVFQHGLVSCCSDLALLCNHGMALGLSYLHGQKITHRDFKSPNVLLDENHVPKVADFGMAKFKTGQDDEAFMSTVCGTPIWMAPEIFREEKYDNKVDTYSFALVVWEMLTLRIPYKGMALVAVLFSVANEGQRPELPEPSDECPQWLLDLIRSCWAQNPSERPTMPSVVKTLARMLVNLRGSGPGSSGRLSSSAGVSLCSLCSNEAKQVLFEPCMDVVSCFRCARTLKKCPACDMPISRQREVKII